MGNILQKANRDKGLRYAQLKRCLEQIFAIKLGCIL